MIKIENITNEPHQRHTVVFQESEITLVLRFLPVVQIWVMFIEYKGKTVNGAKLSVGTLHIRSRNLPFDFYVTDNSGSGLDPVRLDDFSANRCSLYMMEAEDMEQIRGGAVQI